MSAQQLLLDIESRMGVEDAWFVGYKDCERGFVPGANPYQTEERREAWFDGFLEAFHDGRWAKRPM